MTTRDIDIALLLQKGHALHQRGLITEAEAAYKEILTVEPNNFDALHLLGVAAFQRGDNLLSHNLLTRAVELNPSQATAHTNLGNTLQALGNITEAIACHDQAIALAPRHQSAHLNRGDALHDAGRLSEALSSYDRALEIDDSTPEAHNNRSNVLLDMGRIADAVQGFSQALKLRPHYVEAMANKGSALRMLGSYDEALTCIEEALSLAPTHSYALNNRGNILRELREFSEAIQSYSQALALTPNFADAYLNMSYAYLTCGDLRRGFELYEWRRKAPALSRLMRQFQEPPLQELQSLYGKTILVHSEQGFGDTIQFCRYITAVRAQGARVILEVQQSLKLLMQSLAGPEVVIAEGETAPHFDYHVPLLSLPYLFETTRDSIPAPGRYLHSNEEKRASWLRCFSSTRRLRIGLTWSGSRSLAHGSFRSIALSELSPALPYGPEYICLQSEIHEADEEALRSRSDIRVVSEHLKDFSDTAAVIDTLDLVVSVDTAVAHLSGALMRPTHIMLPFNSDWRWLIGRSDSPWYPSATLSRQEKPGKWEKVLSEVHQRIKLLSGEM